MSEPLTVGERPGFEFLGGRICLDFVNTTAWEDDGPVRDRLASFADLVKWARAADVLPAKRAADLLRRALAEPVRSRQQLARALALRATLRELVLAGAQHAPAPPAAVAAFNQFLASIHATLALASDEDGTRLCWSADPSGSDDLLAPILWSATALLGCDDLQRVRECAGTSCGWVYLDESRNRSRRWCDMKVCGNREKARRFRNSKR